MVSCASRHACANSTLAESDGHHGTESNVWSSEKDRAKKEKERQEEDVLLSTYKEMNTIGSVMRQNVLGELGITHESHQKNLSLRCPTSGLMATGSNAPMANPTDAAPTLDSLGSGIPTMDDLGRRDQSARLKSSFETLQPSSQTALGSPRGGSRDNIVHTNASCDRVHRDICQGSNAARLIGTVDGKTYMHCNNTYHECINTHIPRG